VVGPVFRFSAPSFDAFSQAGIIEQANFGFVGFVAFSPVGALCSVGSIETVRSIGAFAAVTASEALSGSASGLSVFGVFALEGKRGVFVLVPINGVVAVAGFVVGASVETAALLGWGFIFEAGASSTASASASASTISPISVGVFGIRFEGRSGFSILEVFKLVGLVVGEEFVVGFVGEGGVKSSGASFSCMFFENFG
jgi:hypothetical protein